MTTQRAKAYSREFRKEVLRLAANSDRMDAELEEDLKTEEEPGWLRRKLGRRTAR